MPVTTRLRELLAQPDLLVAPGAYDALSVRLVAQAGFPVVFHPQGVQPHGWGTALESANCNGGGSSCLGCTVAREADVRVAFPSILSLLSCSITEKIDTTTR